jgi:hypothetical protein
MQEKEYREKIREEAPRTEDGEINWDAVPYISRVIGTGVGGEVITDEGGNVLGISIPIPINSKKFLSKPVRE